MKPTLDEFMQAPRLQPDDTFQFRCTRCAQCCRDVRQAINLSPLDLYHIARHLGMDMADVINRYTEPLEDNPGGIFETFPLLMAKARDHRDACVFLRSGGCTIQEAKPIVCRLYPMNVGPEGKEGLAYFLVSRRAFHYTGDTHTAGQWMDMNLSEEYRRYIPMMYQVALDTGKLIRRIKKLQQEAFSWEQIAQRIIWYLYICYETEGDDFFRQYERNVSLLLKELKHMANGG